MRTYKVTLSRDITESSVVTVVAHHQDEAHDKAMSMAEDAIFMAGECQGVYVAGIEIGPEVKPEPKMLPTTKLFEHDCDHCVYIFTTHGARDYDWYVCLFNNIFGGGSVVARFADYGPNYWSCLISMVRENKFGLVSHTDSDRKSLSPMNLIANMVLDMYEERIGKC